MTWTPRPGAPNILERRLDPTELSFYWDGKFHGTADSIQQAHVQVSDAITWDLFAPENIQRIWTILKRRHPLLGAQLDRGSDNEVFFVIDTDSLGYTNALEKEVKYILNIPADAIAVVADEIINGPRQLSDNLLSRIYVIPHLQSSENYHLLIHVAHCITDGISNTLLLRSFLELLATPPDGQTPDVPAHLNLSVSSTQLSPCLRLNPARQRWRRAVSSIIHANRMAKFSVGHSFMWRCSSQSVFSQGGHTIPRRFSSATDTTPAHSAFTGISLTSEETVRVLASCRKFRLTLGNVYPVVAQLAMARVVLRRYLRGEIGEDEWEFRKREPAHSGGPLNLRPYLDKDWQQAGGYTTVSVHIGFYWVTLPYMPLGKAQKIKPGAEMPSIADMLTLDRFLLRSRLARKQMDDALSHPLTLDMLHVGGPRRVAVNRKRAEENTHFTPSTKLLSPIEQAEAGMVLNHAGSTIGNVSPYHP